MQVSTSRITTSMAVAVVLGVALSGCGGGGGAPVVGAPTVAPPEVRLPAGHGLSAGEITVAAGVSEEHGNVVVTCPAGGGACVLRVSADGTAEYDRTGGIPGVTPALAAWELPRGHGLRAGEITVAAGATERHGNVVVTCPAGEGACVLRVSADGTAMFERTGGTPAFMLAHRVHVRDNPSAEDLLDHWNHPERLREKLGLSAVDPSDLAGRRNALAQLIRTAAGPPAETGTLLRNTWPDNIEIIGERNGITYGRWTGGPAGTLNIEFDWRFAPNFDAETRARMERAGKSWSWRLRDDFGRRAIQQGGRIRANDGEFILDGDVVADDVLIFVFDAGESRSSSAGGYRAELYLDDYEPWLGTLHLSRNHVDGSDLMAHEIGHVLGIGGTVRFQGSLAPPSVERYINTMDHTFEGPEARRTNGGVGVPYQWRLRDSGDVVPPHTPGAEVDYGHLGVCSSLMAYCRKRAEVYVPAEIDFAYLDDIGYDILDTETASEPELYGYGAWGRYSAWGAGVERTIDSELITVEERVDQFTTRYRQYIKETDTLRAGADAFGMPPSSTLADAATSLQGGATWSGSLIGVDLGRPMLPPVFGDAELRVELSSLRGTALFDDLTVFVDDTASAFRASSLEYAIEVAGNAFSDRDGVVRGGFFGPAHEEMAGVLDDRAPDVDLLAGFGGER